MKKSILSLLLACFLQINLAFAQNVMTVSYTHLDVYKRQVSHRETLRFAT